MTIDAYISRFGTDGELAELRKKIEARRFPVVLKKGMRTSEEIRAHLANFEDRFEAETKGAHTPGDALNLEMLGSWIGALRWALGEEVKGRDR